MKNWNNKYLNDLQRSGKIRGFNIPQRRKEYSTDKPMSIPARKPKALVWLEWNLQYWCNQKALTLEQEYKFDELRKWRFDFCITSLKIAIEYEGGIFLHTSGHNTAKHYTKDTEKYNKAVELGWRVIRVTAMNYQTILKTLIELVK